MNSVPGRIIARIPALLVLTVPRCFAPPPLVTGEVPTADNESFEWYLGARNQESESGNPSRLLPFTLSL